MTEDVLFEFECAECGLLDTIDFKPSNPNGLLCVDCHRKRGDKPRYDMSKVAKSPRRTHNTRVAFPIECCVCGKEETLDHIPKGVAFDQIKCSECLTEALPAGAKYNQVAEIKDNEEGVTDYAIVCDECGKDATIPFRPKAGRIYFCKECASDEKPEPKPVAEEPVDDATYERVAIDEGVFKRRKVEPKND